MRRKQAILVYDGIRIDNSEAVDRILFICERVMVMKPESWSTLGIILAELVHLYASGLDDVLAHPAAYGLLDPDVEDDDYWALQKEAYE